MQEKKGRHDARRETCTGQSKTNEVIVMSPLRGSYNGDNKAGGG